MLGPCERCGAGPFDGQGRQPFRGDVCNQCHLKDQPDAFTCVECGNLEAVASWYPEVGAKLKARSLCHGCDHWTDRAAVADVDGKVVVNGSFYGYDPKALIRGGDKSHLGHGGRTFHIRYPDGRIVTTNDLWCGGDIPDHFRDRLPDTAEFVAGSDR